MDRKREIKKNNGRSWLFRSNATSRLGLILIIVCLGSVSLNIFLLFFRNTNLSKSKHLIELSTMVKLSPVYQPRQLPDAMEKALPFENQNDLLRNHSHQRHVELSKRIRPTGKFKPKIKVPKHVTSLSRTGPQCPRNPPGLVGSLRALTEDVTPEQLRKTFTDMEKGGRIRPKDCVPKQRMAIIIPFRNRFPHLYILLANLLPLLQRQMVDATIFVIEQAPPATFNRGALLNIGFIEALKIATFDCFILHDVDLIPLSDRNYYRCDKNPRHFAAAMNKFRFKLMYETYFGGVVGFSREQYEKVNGNSNLYFGWGGEDDDLYMRLINKNYTMDRYDMQTSRYMMIKHIRDKGNDKNSERRKLMKSSLKRQDVEGLNTTRYNVNSIIRDQLYTWINVSLDLKEILETAPNYTKHDIWKLIRDVKAEKVHK